MPHSAAALLPGGPRPELPQQFGGGGGEEATARLLWLERLVWLRPGLFFFFFFCLDFFGIFPRSLDTGGGARAYAQCTLGPGGAAWRAPPRHRGKRLRILEPVGGGARSWLGRKSARLGSAPLGSARPGSARLSWRAGSAVRALFYRLVRLVAKRRARNPGLCSRLSLGYAKILFPMCTS